MQGLSRKSYSLGALAAVAFSTTFPMATAFAQPGDEVPDNSPKTYIRSSDGKFDFEAAMIAEGPAIFPQRLIDTYKRREKMQMDMAPDRLAANFRSIDTWDLEDLSKASDKHTIKIISRYKMTSLLGVKFADALSSGSDNFFSKMDGLKQLRQDLMVATLFCKNPVLKRGTAADGETARMFEYKVRYEGQGGGFAFTQASNKFNSDAAWQIASETAIAKAYLWLPDNYTNEEMTSTADSIVRVIAKRGTGLPEFYKNYAATSPYEEAQRIVGLRANDVDIGFKEGARRGLKFSSKPSIQMASAAVLKTP